MPRTYEIHPAVGIARVGNSPEFFLAPEPGQAPPPKYRDNDGKLRRQAARFRVFECERDDSGRLQSARELTAADARIEWRVHLANRKGAAPNFTGGGNRNGATGNDATDRALIIDPGERTLAGPGQGPAKFDNGQFKGVVVPLGEIHTDAEARLLVLGGSGTSDSVPAQPNPSRPIGNFADNNDWYDDVSDGPVQATLTLTGTNETVTAKRAWVIVGPPDFAPEVINLVTLYDVAFQIAVDQGWRSIPNPSSFTRDIQSVLSRAVGYQWVNRIARGGHSGNRPGNFARDWAALANPASPPPIAARLLRRIRDPRTSPAAQPAEPDLRRWMPRLHDETNTSAVLPVTRVQYAALLNWSTGNFVNDLDQSPPPELLPDALDRVALQSCSGGAFFPGIEVGQIMTRSDSYVEAFRLNADAFKPGELTQGNALPWQADFLACAFEMQPNLAWWPAQRPDDVLPESALTIPLRWDRGITGDLGELGLVKSWHRLGVVVRRQTPGGEIFVETERMLDPMV